MWQPPPNAVDYLAFIRSVMGITIAQLPDNSPFIGYTLAVAEEIVDPLINQISGTMFVLATYNLAGDRLINFAPDQTGQTLFADTRKSLKLNSFTSGVVQSANDQGTGETLLPIEAAKNLTFLDIQFTKTPWGNQYLSIAQQTGPLWGLS